MYAIELVLALLVAVAALATLAHRLGIPYPIVLVLGGLLIGLVPGLPGRAAGARSRLPAVPAAAALRLGLLSPRYATSAPRRARSCRWRSAWCWPRPSWWRWSSTRPSRAWAGRSPSRWAPSSRRPTPSPPRRSSRRLPVPRGIVTVLEGESLLNDATGLVAFRVAVVAAVTGALLARPGDRELRAGRASAASPSGWRSAGLSRGCAGRLHDPPVEITISLLTPFAAYLPAEVARRLGRPGHGRRAGCISGRQAPSLMEADTRVQGRAVWETLVFLLDGLVFVLIGLQLPAIVARLAARPPLWLAALALLVCGSVVRGPLRLGVCDRLAGPPAALAAPTRAPPGAKTSSSRGRACAGSSHWPPRWRCPFTTASGAPFQERDLLIFLTVCVILVTLVGQGLTFPWVSARSCACTATGPRRRRRPSAREVGDAGGREVADRRAGGGMAGPPAADRHAASAVRATAPAIDDGSRRRRRRRTRRRRLLGSRSRS